MIPIAIFANESTEEEDADYLPFSDNDEPVIPRYVALFLVVLVFTLPRNLRSDGVIAGILRSGRLNARRSTPARNTRGATRGRIVPQRGRATRTSTTTRTTPQPRTPARRGTTARGAARGAARGVSRSTERASRFTLSDESDDEDWLQDVIFSSTQGISITKLFLCRLTRTQILVDHSKIQSVC